jgi:DNA-binding beta-propeller fold protein YncE
MSDNKSSIPMHKLAARRLTGTLLGLAVAGTVAVLGGCAAPPPKEMPRLVWPEPPEKARIEFVRAIVSDDDLGKGTTASQSLLRFLEGEKPAKNRIVTPMGLAISADGERLYISDNAQAAIFVYDFAKKTAFEIGGEDKPLAAPMQLALDAQENIYVVEQQKQGVSVFDRTGKPLRFITDASIVRPTGIAIDSARGKIYVSDTSHGKTGDHTVKIFDLEGKFLGKLGVGKGDIQEAFLFPTFLTVDAKGNLYVADTLNSRVQEFDADGKFVQQIGKRGTAWGQFDKPKGVAVDSFGNIYVADSGWSNVQLFNGKGQALMFFGGRGTYPGLMQNPTVLAIDKNDRIYVGDALNYRINVYQLVNTSAADSIGKEDATAKKADAAAKTEAPAK